MSWNRSDKIVDLQQLIKPIDYSTFKNVVIDQESLRLLECATKRLPLETRFAIVDGLKEKGVEFTII